jgi:hypothetical protein
MGEDGRYINVIGYLVNSEGERTVPLVQVKNHF